MKITAFNGSPRGEKSNTNTMVREFLAGANEAGAEVENIFLVNKKIKPCIGCFSCWNITPGECTFRDDMDELISKFITSDIVVLATPLYVDNVTGIMKNFLERLCPIVDPHFEKDEQGEYRHKKRYDKYPGMVVISNCGYPEQSHFQVLHLLFERVARNFHSRIIAKIYRGAGELLQSLNPKLTERIASYRQLLRQAGIEIATNSELSEKLKEELETPLIPHNLYIKTTNRYWDKSLAELKHKKEYPT